jgi:hypothetical protein
MWMRIRGVPEERFPPVAKVLHAVSWIVPVTVVLVVVADKQDEEYDW